MFVEQASGAQRDRPQLQAALDYARSGDTLSQTGGSTGATGGVMLRRNMDVHVKAAMHAIMQA